MSEIWALSCLSIKYNMYASLCTLITLLAQGNRANHSLGPQPKVLSGPTPQNLEHVRYGEAVVRHHLSGGRRQWWWCLTVERAELRNRGVWHEDAGKAQGGDWRLHLWLYVKELWLWPTMDRCAMRDETDVHLATNACLRTWARCLST